METQNLTITPTGRIFIILWSIALVILFTGLGLFIILSVNQLRVDAMTRHNARIDPHAVEPGRTAAEDKLPPGANPRKVKVGIYLDGIASISILDSLWNPVFYIWFRWTGDDINPGETFDIVDGEILSKEKLSETVVNGEHYVEYLVKAQITKYFDASRFPVDDHLLTLVIEDGEMDWLELEYVPDTTSSNFSSRVKMPGYKISQTGLVMKPHTYKTNFGKPQVATNVHETFSQLIYGVWNVRPGFGPYLKVFIGLFAAVLTAMLVFFIKAANVDARLGLGVGGFFGAVANTLLSSSLVPDSGILTLMDMVNGLGMITIFLTLVQSTISFYLYESRNEVGLSHLFDRVSVVIFGIGFIVINAIVPFIGIVY